MKPTGEMTAAVVVFTLSVCMAGLLLPRLTAANPQHPDMLVQVLGGMTELAAESAYRKADAYFHAGVTGEHLHDHPEESAANSLPFMDVIQRLHCETTPKDHRHLKDEEQQELLPWFVTAVRLNPAHIDAWRDGAFWFYHVGNTRRAQEFISDGIRHNPEDYRLYMDRGLLYFRMKRWNESVDDFGRARVLWRNCSDDSQLELRAIRLYLSHALEHCASASTRD